MKLRTRLLLANAYLVALLVATAALASLGFFNLAGKIDRVLTDNYGSIEAAMEMLTALERQDSATLSLLLEPGGALEELRAAEETFLVALVRAGSNLTLANEVDLLDEIRTSYGDLHQAREELLADTPERPLRRYRETAFPAFERVKSEVLHLLEANQREMHLADERARKEALQTGIVLGFLVVVAVLSLAFTTQRIQRHLLLRLDHLRAAAEGIAQGDRLRRLRIDGNDELSLVARALNAAVDREIAAESRLTGELARAEASLLALLAKCAAPALLLALDGRLIGKAGNVPASATFRDTLTSRLRQEELAVASGVEVVTVEIEGAFYDCGLLQIEETPVAWLVRPAAPAS